MHLSLDRRYVQLPINAVMREAWREPWQPLQPRDQQVNNILTVPWATLQQHSRLHYIACQTHTYVVAA